MSTGTKAPASGGLDAAVAKVGGQRNAMIIGGAGLAGVVWFIGRRKNAAAQQANATTTAANGFSDTAVDPTAVYTGYDQLQQEIDNLRNQPAGAPNTNPVPVPTSGGTPPPVAPVPTPVPTSAPTPAQLQQHFDSGVPLPSNRPPQPWQQPAPFFNGGPPIHWGG